ncbi:MAG: hypothetical protein FJ184_06680 [Gammaproteobacteria bacterium]|nr:hypothetical protein [Phycisphaerae bacterium]MBM4230421.1 hypothetical protein [Gammaproteobacteria bacterium]
MTPDFPITVPLTKDRFERLQTWIGVDCESEWFTISATGVVVELEGVELRAVPNAMLAAAHTRDLRFRTVFRVDSSEARVTMETVLADGGMLTLRDAFGTERLQVLPRSSRLRANLTPGRYSVDGILTPHSLLIFKLQAREQAALTRLTQVG